MRLRGKIEIVTLGATLCGCTTATIQRWSNVANLPASSLPSLHITSAPADPPDDLTVKSLPDHASAAYVAALAAKVKTPKDLRANVAKSITAAPEGVQDGTTISRVLLATVERPMVRPGDRLLMTRIVVRPADPNVTFTNYQLAATERATINVGTVTITDTYGATGGIGPGGAASANVLPNLSLSASRALGASRNVNQESIFAVSAEPNRLEIFRTGAEDRDLLGNTLIKLSLKYGTLIGAPIFWVADASITDDDTGAPLPPSKATINVVPLALYAPRDLWVCVRMDYEDRQVYDPRSEDEGNQSVSIASGTIPEFAQKIVPYQDLQKLLWKIRDQNHSKLAYSDSLAVRELSFDDYDSAVDFLAWVKLKHPVAIKNGRLGVNVGALLRPIRNYSALTLEPAQESIGSPGAPPSSCPLAN